MGITGFEMDVKCMAKNLECRTPEINGNAMMSVRFMQNHIYVFRLLIFITSLLGVACLFIRQHYKNEWFRLSKNQGIDSQNIFSFYSIQDQMTGNMKDYNNRRCSKFFIFELLILLICPIPFYETYIKINYFVVHKSPTG